MITTIATEDALHEIESESGMTIPWAQVNDDATFVIEQNDEVVFAAGAVTAWPGFGQAWTVTLRDKVKEPVAFTKEVKRLIEHIMDEQGYRQLRVMSFDIEGIRWNEALGFKLECVWEDAGPHHEDVFVLVYHRRH